MKVWQRLSNNKMIVWLDNDCESYIIKDYDASCIGKK